MSQTNDDLIKSNESKKRSKQWFHKQNKRVKTNGCLTEGLTGFVVTCNLKEYNCLKESYSLFNEFADKLYGSYNELKETDEEDKEVDIESALQNEINLINNNEKRFQQLMTKCKNVLFIKSNDKSVDPLVMCSEIFKEIETNGKQLTRFLLRLLPIVTTFKPNCNNFDEIIESQIDSKTKDPISYVIVSKVRNNSEITRLELIEKVVSVVKRVRPQWTVDFAQPKLTISLDVLQKICCLSFLNDYNNYCKYNLIEFSKKCFKQLNENKSESKV